MSPFFGERVFPLAAEGADNSGPVWLEGVALEENRAAPADHSPSATVHAGRLAGRSGSYCGFRALLYGLMIGILAIAGGCSGEEAESPAERLETGTEVGNRAPRLAGVLADESEFALDDRPSSITVLIFYRSAQCGLCRLQLEQAQRHLPAYEYQGARIVGVTLDAPEISRTLLDELSIQFDLASVPRAVFETWQVLRPDAEVPLPATFIVDRDGIVRYRHIGRNAADRSSDAGILTVLQTLGS